MRGRVQVLLVSVPFLVGATAEAAQAQPDHEVLAHFTDPTLTEASGLVVNDQGWAVVNDSGNAGDLFLVDPATGDTTRTIRFSDDPEDVEALAPEGDDVVWVGDIGDNRRQRSELSLYRVPLDGGAVRQVKVRYPDGAHDAESLARHPKTGELLVLTKGILGGDIYRVPTAALESGADAGTVHTMELVDGGVPSLATDAAFTPDGKHLLVRNYSSMTVLTWPGVTYVAKESLPSQRQGEALAVQSDGKVVLASEGLDAPVLRIATPVAVEPSASPSATPSSTGGSAGATSTPGAVDTEPAAKPTRSRWDSVGTVAAGALALGLAVVVVMRRARRRRG